MSNQNKNFKYIRAVTTIFFDELTDIRSRIAEFDNLLGPLFNAPGLTYAVGETMPPSVPRLNYHSKFGHTSLDISCISAQMITNFDGEFCQKFDLIKHYCLEREKLIEQDIVRLGSKVRYVGFTLTSQVSLKDRKQPVGSILKNFFQSSVAFSKAPIHEAGFKVTFAENEKYFVNVHINNFRSYTLVVPVSKSDEPIRIVNPSMKDFTESESGIEVTLDSNNKYVFDLISKDGHKPEDFKNIMELTDQYHDQVMSGGQSFA